MLAGLMLIIGPLLSMTACFCNDGHKAVDATRHVLVEYFAEILQSTSLCDTVQLVFVLCCLMSGGP